MSKKQIEVACPCCASVLVVDVLTSKVMGHRPPSEVDETGKPVLDEGRWQSAAERVAGRHTRGKDGFDAALGKEQSRESDLDDLFDAAQRKLKKRKKDLEGGGGF